MGGVRTGAPRTITPTALTKFDYSTGRSTLCDIWHKPCAKTDLAQLRSILRSK
jgi:hypothetical protein